MNKKTIEASIVFGILDLRHQLTKEKDKSGKSAGVTSQQWSILLLLNDDPNMTYASADRTGTGLYASQLADALKVSRPNITNLVNVLVNKGLVDKVADAVDRRKKKLLLSKKGQAVVSNLNPEKTIAENKFLSCLSNEEKKTFYDLIVKCLNCK